MDTAADNQTLPLLGHWESIGYLNFSQDELSMEVGTSYNVLKTESGWRVKQKSFVAGQSGQDSRAAYTQKFNKDPSFPPFSCS